MRVGAGDSVGEFVQVGLAEQDGPGAGKFSRDRGIFRRNKIAQNFRSGSRADAARPNSVLERDGYPEERGIFMPRTAAVEQLFFRAARSSERVLCGDRQECVQRGISQLDAAQKQFGQLDGGNPAFCQQRGESLDGRKGGRFFLLHGQKSFSSRRRFPNVPIFAMFSERRNWFSVRITPSERRRYSNEIPQQRPVIADFDELVLQDTFCFTS